jgi:hypothetical protein
MRRNIKIVGLIGTALFAIAGMAAPAAQAAPFFTTSVSPVILTGEKIAGEQFIKTSAGKTECAGSKWEGTGINGSTAMALRLSYSKCMLNGEMATVEQNGCEYNFTLVQNSNPATGTFEILCTGTPKEITIKTATCVIHIEEQATGLSHVIFSNTGGLVLSTDMSIAVTGIKYTATFGCPGSHATQSNGEYKETVKVKAEREGTEQSIWVE